MENKENIVEKQDENNEVVVDKNDVVISQEQLLKDIIELKQKLEVVEKEKNEAQKISNELYKNFKEAREIKTSDDEGPIEITKEELKNIFKY